MIVGNSPDRQRVSATPYFLRRHKYHPDIKIATQIVYCTVTVATAPATGMGCMPGSLAPPFEMVRVDWPLLFAMKVNVTTAPCPDTPLEPGGRVAVICIA